MAVLLAAPSKNAVQKTLAAQLLSSAGNGDPITFDDVDGIPNLPGVLVIRRINANGEATPEFREYIEYSGTSGSTVIIETRNVDGSNAALTHPVGSIVEFIPDVVWADRIYDALSNVIDPSDLSLDTTKVVDITTPQSLSNKSISLGGSNYIHASGATISAIVDEDDMASDSAVKIPTQQSTKAYVDTKVAAAAPSDGWIAAGETWVYASADDPTFTFTIAGVDLTTKYYPGMRIKLTQTSAKYFIITAVAFSTNTTVTVYGGTDYDLANATITSPFYSREKAPAGFPLDPIKWSVAISFSTSSAFTQASPTSGTWYDTGFGFVVPIGAWRVSYSTNPGVQVSSASNEYVMSGLGVTTADVDGSVVGTRVYVPSTNVNSYMFHVSFPLSVAAKTTEKIWVRIVGSNISNSYMHNDFSGFGSLTCAYL